MNAIPAQQSKPIFYRGTLATENSKQMKYADSDSNLLECEGVLFVFFARRPFSFEFPIKSKMGIVANKQRRSRKTRTNEKKTRIKARIYCAAQAQDHFSTTHALDDASNVVCPQVVARSLSLTVKASVYVTAVSKKKRYREEPRGARQCKR